MPKYKSNFLISIFVVLSFIGWVCDTFAAESSSTASSTCAGGITVNDSESCPECYEQCPGKGTAYAICGTCSDSLSSYPDLSLPPVCPTKCCVRRS
ncbi:MAG: hypothetical protein LBE20_01740 [Deltaproteobacteria bacterium]|jgi:hypothetical protein|nr:hypothetical protein [Deltaproteobacteria bacterium]